MFNIIAPTFSELVRRTKKYQVMNDGRCYPPAWPRRTRRWWWRVERMRMRRPVRAESGLIVFTEHIAQDIWAKMHRESYVVLQWKPNIKHTSRLSSTKKCNWNKLVGWSSLIFYFVNICQQCFRTWDKTNHANSY